MEQRISTQRSIMLDFAASTGLSDPSREPRRYLWTDAFAVCNFLELYTQTEDRSFLQLALQLVDQVHQVLGQHREDSKHSGWLSGLDEAHAREHPTQGGLRIGKRLDERPPGETIDQSVEWDRDGQYFHYLTKWMHALNRVSGTTGNPTYNRWALELAKVAHSKFTYSGTRREAPRMYWKMSIDLSRPLIDTMGQHDPLDGLITYWQLAGTANQVSDTSSVLSLDTEIAGLLAICAGRSWATEDALGIGGLLGDAYKLVQLMAVHQVHEAARLEALLGEIENSLRVFVRHDSLHFRTEYRLAFRELGLAIGLQAISKMQARIGQQPECFTNASQLLAILARLTRYHALHQLIENIWLEPAHQAMQNWLEHTDINRVMLATTLAPDGYLQL